jgi:hypothetical protein
MIKNPTAQIQKSLDKKETHKTHIFKMVEENFEKCRGKQNLGKMVIITL